MIPFEVYFTNPFSSPEFGAGRLLAFTTDHLQRLAAANLGGNWPARIAATEAALTALNARMTTNETSLGRRKSRKLVLRTFRRGVSQRLSALNVALQAKYGERAPELKLFFPHGRRAFTRCADDVLGSWLNMLAGAVTSRAAELGPDVVALAASLVADWQPVYAASETAASTKAAAEEARRAARSALQRELYLNLLALAQTYPEEPAKLHAFMQQSYLTRKKAR